MNIGEILYKNRINKKLTIEEISKDLKISKDILLKFENNDIKKNADIVFIIGHLRAYSRFLDLDQNQVVGEFKKQISYNENIVSHNITKPFSENYKFNINKILSFVTIFIICSSFYFLFVSEDKGKPEFALIPDIPESDLPTIEKLSIENIAINKIENENNSNNFSSVIASTDNYEEHQSSIVTLKILNPTWIQVRNVHDKILLSKLMDTNEEYSYNIENKYNITAGNAGNIIVVIDNIVKGKIGKYGEVLDSFVINKNFSR